MSRIISCGFELNSAANAMEVNGITGVGVVNTNVASGTYAASVSSLVSGSSKRARWQISPSANNKGPYFIRVKFRFATLPSGQNRILYLSNSATENISVMAYITIDNTGVLRLFDEDGQIGSASGPLSTNTYYTVELYFDSSGSAGAHICRARLNYVEFAGASNRDISGGVQNFYVGANLGLEANTTGSWNFDDVAVNDGNGSYQNSYPGEGHIVHLKPDGNSSVQWTRGGTDSGANWSQLDELPPNDITDYVESNTLNQTDDYTLENTPAGLLSLHAIKVAAVGVRSRGAGASANASYILRFNGIETDNSAAAGQATTWRTHNSPNTTLSYVLQVYDMPGTSNTKIHKSDLDAATIGIRLTATSTNPVQVSALWLMVEYDDSLLYDPVKGALGFGVQTPTNSEVPVSYQTFTNGAGAVPSISGDADWGKLSLPVGAEGRSKVYDFGDSNSRQYTINRDVYGTGSGAVTIQIRGSTTAFNQDDSSPSWTTYTTPTVQSWRYVQVRVVGA